MPQLEGKVIIVTGAGRGLGRAFAEAIAREGARVALAEIQPDLGQSAAESLLAAGHQAMFVQTDIADQHSVEEMVQAVAERWGGIDGLVNNAAIATGVGGKRFDQIEPSEFDRILGVNVRGTWQVCKAVYPHLRRRGGGKIVNIPSDTALWGAPLLLHYVASKGAVIAMTRSLAREMGPDNIAVNCIAPGLTRVEVTELVPEERHRLYEQGRAMQRPQIPEDITGTVVFLLSDHSTFLTGQLLPVNGGFVFN